MKKDSVLYTVVFVAVLSFFFVGILALVQGSTAERVALYKESAKKAAFLDSLGILYGSLDEAREIFDRVLIPLGAEGAYKATVNGIEYIAIETRGAGLWGTIVLICAADKNGIIRGVQITDQNETPGLGGRITERAFLNQFRDKETSSWKIKINAGAESGSKTTMVSGMVDGVTGATRTSQALETIINAALEEIRVLWGAQ